VSYETQALAVVRKTPEVKFFGPTTGFIVNYTSDRAIRFDLEGQVVETFPRVYRPGEVTLFLSGRQISVDSFGRILGTWPKRPTPRA
jgi:hypothetical protein